MPSVFYYFTPSDLQVARVDRQCIVRFCDALTGHFSSVNLVSIKIKLSKHEISSSSLYSLYGIKESVNFILLNSGISQEKRTKAGYVEQYFKYLVFSLKEFTSSSAADKIVFLKNYHFISIILFINSFIKNKIFIFFEPHRMPKNFLQKQLLKKVNGIVANSFALEKDIVEKFPELRQKTIGTHQGIDLEYVNRVRLTKEEARRKLKLPIDKFLAVYTGKVHFGYKEIDYYIRAAKLSGDDIHFLIVGGREDHVNMLRNECKEIGNISFVSFIPPSEIYYYQFAADALLLYYPSGIEINKYRSPGKIFDYMASGAAIISADYPVIEEIVRPNIEALFAEKDNPEKLAEKIKILQKDKELRNKLSENALKRVEEFTWQKRGEQVKSLYEKNKFESKF